MQIPLICSVVRGTFGVEGEEEKGLKSAIRMGFVRLPPIKVNTFLPKKKRKKKNSAFTLVQSLKAHLTHLT